ncbi:hypothetical protein [Sporosarcina cyprini]|uniref:hypothetical protein n=1 Tax=Sporosarcina cyprini TaxID=2910523 RepID=UPI001EDE62FC|nr:hypothetical protein [Sporosarcina cyprini]MCG3087211.1 hypothetical protein [Sporosarcina cyprini]
MEDANRNAEIEQLKKKVERYREALSSIKTEYSSDDLQLKKKFDVVEKNLDNLDTKVKELALLLEEGLHKLSEKIIEVKERLEEVDRKRESGGSGDLHRHTKHPDHLPTHSRKERMPSQRNTAVPSFNQLRKLAEKTANANTPSPRSRPSYEVPPVHEESERPHIPEEDAPDSPMSTEDIQETSQLMETSKDAPVLSKGKEAVPIESIRNDNTSPSSPFWRKFKKN